MENHFEAEPHLGLALSWLSVRPVVSTLSHSFFVLWNQSHVAFGRRQAVRSTLLCYLLAHQMSIHNACLTHDNEHSKAKVQKSTDSCETCANPQPDIRVGCNDWKHPVQ